MVAILAFRRCFTRVLLCFFCLNALSGHAQFESSEVHDWSIVGGALATRVFYGIKKAKFKAEKPFEGRGIPGFLSFDKGTLGNSSYNAAKTSDWFLYSSIGGLTLGGVYSKQGTYLGLQTMAITDLTNLLAKNVVRRRRPFTYGSCSVNHGVKKCKKYDREDYDASLSFYSGHTAQVAAFSYFALSMLWFTTPSLQKGDGDLLFLVGGAIPAITGHLRIRAGKHFPSDVIIGYLAGAATGYLVPRWHRDREAGFALDKLNDKMGLALLSGIGTSGLLILISKAAGKPKKGCLECTDVGLQSSRNKVKFAVEPQIGISNGLRMSLRF